MVECGQWGVILLGFTLEMMVPKTSFARRLEKQMDFDWLINQVKPYFPDAQDRTTAALSCWSTWSPMACAVGTGPSWPQSMTTGGTTPLICFCCKQYLGIFRHIGRSLILGTFRSLKMCFILLPVSSRRKCCGSCWPTS